MTIKPSSGSFLFPLLLTTYPQYLCEYISVGQREHQRRLLSHPGLLPNQGTQAVFVFCRREPTPGHSTAALSREPSDKHPPPPSYRGTPLLLSPKHPGKAWPSQISIVKFQARRLAFFVEVLVLLSPSEFCKGRRTWLISNTIVFCFCCRYLLLTHKSVGSSTPLDQSLTP